MSKHIKIFDTTLRDGEQSRLQHGIKEKIQMAKQRRIVDIIEAGLPFPPDFKSVRAVAVRNRWWPAGQGRKGEDIDRAWEAVSVAEQPGFTPS